MAEIDSLEIKISAESGKAESALDRVISKLEAIQKLTKGKGLDELSKSLDDISTKAQNINVDKIASSMDKVAQKSATMSKKVSKNLDEVAQKNKEAAEQINKFVRELKQPVSKNGMGLTDEGAEKAKKQILDIYNYQKRVYDYLNEHKGKVSEAIAQGWSSAFRSMGKDVEDTISKFSHAQKKVDDIDAQIRDFTKHYSKKISLKPLEGIYEKKDIQSYLDMMGSLKSKFTFTDNGESIFTFINDLNASLDSSKRQLHESESGFVELANVIANTRREYVSFEQDANSFKSSPNQEVKGLIEVLTEIAKAASAADYKIQQTAQAIRDLMMQGQGIPRITDNIYRAEQAFNADIGKGGIKDIPPLLESAETRIVAIRDTFQQASDRIEEATERVYAFQSALGGANQQLLRDSRNDPIDVPYRISDPDLNFNWDMIDARAKQMEELQDSVDGLDFAKASAGVAALGIALEKLGKTLDKLGNFGIRLLGLNDAISKIKSSISKINLFTPLKGVVEEYKEKFDTIKEHFDDFVKKFKAGVTKMSAFWKRAMRTFTFMILRKAFTQIIKDIHEATESLALFSKEMGTTFNENISNAIADFKWIGKAIVGAFEPIINYVVPVLNVLSAALVKVITLLGEFFAALTGQKYYMVAKKKVDDYADSLKKAAKEAKKSIRPFDELNLITSGNNKGDDNGLNPMADWDMKPVSDKMKKFADMIKDIAKKLFAPIKKAWDRTKDYVISGFKYMVGELGKLAKSIGRDFLKAWQEEQTVHIFENIFNMVGDIERVVGNLAKNFRKAWDTVVDGETRGYWIFHNILKIIDTITTHLRNVTKYMVEWSESITFDALLDSFIRLLSALDKVADFIGGVFEDVMKNVVLEYIKWLIEEGTPHLLNTISEIIDAFDFDKIREDLVPVEKAFEKLLENIHTGVTNAIGVLGKALADWMNSENFTKFMESLAHIMQQITAERVEKVLEALGLAILQIAEAVADFVSSEGFLKFIDKIGEWIDSKSAEDLAGYVKGIIELTAAFKGLSVALPILGKILKLAAGIKLLGNIGKIAKALSGASKAGEVIAGADPFIKSLEATGIQAGGIAKALAGLKTVLTGDIAANVAAGGATAAATFATSFIAGIAAAIGGWNFGQWLDKKLNGDEGMGSFKEQMQGVIGAFTDGSWKDALKLWGEDISSAYSEIWADSKAQREGAISDLNKQLSEAKANMKSNWEGVRADVSQSLQTTRQEVTTNWTAISTEIKTTVAGIKTDVSTNWQAIKTDVSTQLNQIKTDAFAKWTEIKENASSKLTELKTDIQTKWTEIKSFFNEGLAYIKAKFANFSLAGMGSRIVNSFLSGLRSAWQSVSSFIHSKVEEIKSKFNLNFTFDFSGNGGGIRAFATGGFPEDGTFFRASHGEMIGEFDNGQSVVANNQQIVDGIRAGVYDAMMQAIPSLAQAVGGDTNVVIEGDMSKMFRAMVKENYGANKRTFNASPLYS